MWTIEEIYHEMRDGHDITPGMAIQYAQHQIKWAVAAEREACAAMARECAAHYPPGSDGRNTFILLADWIENRAHGA